MGLDKLCSSFLDSCRSSGSFLLICRRFDFLGSCRASGTCLVIVKWLIGSTLHNQYLPFDMQVI